MVQRGRSKSRSSGAGRGRSDGVGRGLPLALRFGLSMSIALAAVMAIVGYLLSESAADVAQTGFDRAIHATSRAMSEAQVLPASLRARINDAMEERMGAQFDPSEVENWNPDRKARVLETDANSFANAFRIYAESELGDELHRITAPTLILTGENDVGSSPRIAQAMAERIPGAELEVFPELRHAVLLEAPDLVAERIAAFVAKLEA